MIVVEVAVAAPVSKTYSYRLSTVFEKQCRSSPEHLVGSRVYVPFGSRNITGYILRIKKKEASQRELKEIYEILDETALFHKEMVPLFEWIANYYHYPLGKVIQTALPAGLSVQSGTRLLLTGQKNSAELLRVCRLYPDVPWLKKLSETGKLSHAMSKKVMALQPDKKLARSLIDDGLVRVVKRRTKELVRKKTEICYCLAEKKAKEFISSGDQLSERSTEGSSALSKNLSQGEKKAISHACDLSTELNDRLIPRKELLIRYPYARKVIPSLIEKDIVQEVEKRIFRSPYGDLLPHLDPPSVLTDEQQRAVKSITEALDSKLHKTVLLHGITGSGKTEVYLKSAEHAVEMGKSVLLLVPEIALATQIEAHFVSRFGARVALLHSGLAAGERFDEWERVCSGERNIVIGARSAVFAPLKDIGLIIVDEEHDSSFKQEDQLRYNSRDIAVLRSKLCQAVTLLGSATPAITTYYHTLSEKFQRIEMKRRVGASQLPEISVIDLRNNNREPNTLFKKTLVSALKETYEQGNQSILLMNRRGFSASVICRDCGSMVECRHCKVTLNMHKGKKQLICHYCGFQLPINCLCTTCGSENLYPVGFGTERVEEEVKKVLPEARIARIDSDTARDRKRLMSILREVRERHIDILVGTQMIAKGLHFPDVTMVGVVWADGGLAFPDYRAAEKTFQLIAQVTGRAGRGDKPGKVIIQTMQPHHYAIRLAAMHEYQQLISRELEIRKEAGFPPFVRLVSVRIEGEKEKRVRAYAFEIASRARTWSRSHGDQNVIQILGPAPAPIIKIRDVYRWQVLFKASNISCLHGLVQFVNTSSKTPKKTKLIIDVDPENML